MADHPGAFDMEEVAAAKNLGVPKKMLAVARFQAGLKEGTHWMRVAGRVAYTVEGLEQVLGRLGIAGRVGDELAAAQKNAAGPRVPGPPTEAVVSRLFPNRHVVGISVAGREERLWVRDAGKFRAGMVVPLAGRNEAGFWLLGRKEPRFAGRW